MIIRCSLKKHNNHIHKIIISKTTKSLGLPNFYNVKMVAWLEDISILVEKKWREVFMRNGEEKVKKQNKSGPHSESDDGRPLI